MSSRVCKEDPPVRLGGRHVNDAKVRSPSGIEVHPDLKALDLQILEIDLAVEIERIEVPDANLRQQAIDLAQPFPAARVVQFDVLHLDCIRWQGGVKVLDLGTDAIL